MSIDLRALDKDRVYSTHHWDPIRQLEVWWMLYYEPSAKSWVAICDQFANEGHPLYGFTQPIGVSQENRLENLGPNVSIWRGRSMVRQWIQRR